MVAGFSGCFYSVNERQGGVCGAMLGSGPELVVGKNVWVEGYVVSDSSRDYFF